MRPEHILMVINDRFKDKLGDKEFTITSYKPGSKRIYHLALKRKDNGAIIWESDPLYHNELKKAIDIAFMILRFLGEV